MDFLDLFSNGKSSGPGPRRMDRAARLGSTMDRGGTDKRVRRRLGCAQVLGLVGAHAVVVDKDEPDEVVSKGCSPEHKQQWRGTRDGGKEQRWLELGARAKEGTRELEREGKKGQ
jgi:hypothetical protein